MLYTFSVPAAEAKKINKQPKGVGEGRIENRGWFVKISQSSISILKSYMMGNRIVYNPCYQPRGISREPARRGFPKEKVGFSIFIINNLPKETIFLVRSPYYVGRLGWVGKNKDLFYPVGSAGG